VRQQAQPVQVVLQARQARTGGKEGGTRVWLLGFD
jgi:hypothetical protein